ncbi:hypothetical protein C8Q79DRAFT_447210 [Trametes meyenii]|nr:hypothetical protein C8Q79DRAFT_447210 [Trametes meyenii]
MQFKTAIVIASVAAAALAAPAPDVQGSDLSASNFTLTTALTTQTFTASVVLESFQPKEPFVTTISTDDVFTVTRTVTRVVGPTSPSTATPQA